MKSAYFHIASILLLLSPVAAHASATTKDLQAAYEGQVLTFRQFYSGTHLRFDAAGKPESAATIGPWTVDGQLRVQKISLEEGVIHIRAQRLFLFYDPGSKQLRDVGTLTKSDPENKRFDKKIAKWAADAGKTEIELECGQLQPDMADVAKVMNAVFLASGEQLADVVPIYWKRWIEANLSPVDAASKVDTPSKTPANQAVTAEKFEKVGGSVSAPHANYTPDPAYSETARSAKYQATVLISLIIDRDGKPTHIRVSMPGGMGLDEQAFAAVRTWRFNPAMRNGEPVPALISVEVDFRLH